APLGVPALRNLLSCPLGPPGAPAGHVVLANKPNGFTSHDAAVLQGAAHLISRALRRPGPAPGERPGPPPDAVRLLDRVSDGVLLVEEGGPLVYANAVWLGWTGFAPDEVVGRPAPFPFWVSHRELVAAGGLSGAVPAGALPF